MTDPESASITFSVQHLGMFSSQGLFRKFSAEFQIDPTQVETSRIAVSIDASSVTMAWSEAASMLRSSDFFDTDNHPTMRYTCVVIDTIGPGKYLIHGTLEMRGIKQPVHLTATLIERQGESDIAPRQADFTVVGHLSRSAFGMVSRRWLISDTVDIRIKARIHMAERALAR